MVFNIKEHQERLSNAVRLNKNIVAISVVDYNTLIAAWKNLNWHLEPRVPKDEPIKTSHKMIPKGEGM